jgi:hypothetical protein
MGKVTEWRAAEEREVPLVGRQAEVQAVARALRSRQSRLIFGVSGIGKTRLLEEALSRYHGPHSLLCTPGVLHELLVRLAEVLRCRIARYPTLSDATSIALKGAVLDALKAEPRPILLEDFEHADPRMYRFLQEVYHVPGNCLIVTARSRDCLGHLRKLLWDPREEISLKPLMPPECKKLFGAATSKFGLGSLDLEDFRQKVLMSARGNPGQILAMCRLAARREYQDGRHIKFLPLRMDVLPAFVG